MASTVIGVLCKGLLSVKGRSTLKSFSKIYVIVYVNKVIVELILTRPSRKMRWEIEKPNNKMKLITVLYEKDQEYITYIHSVANLHYLGLNRANMLLLETIFKWVD